MEQDYEIGSTIQEKIISHVVSWFTGEDGEEDDKEEEDYVEENDEKEDDENENEKRRYKNVKEHQ
ncbi:hypothetical protein P3S68_011379 [Capsicum galapagoense]